MVEIRIVEVRFHLGRVEFTKIINVNLVVNVINIKF